MSQRIAKPHYNLHQIDTGKYTSGNEYALVDGQPYTGPYHILPNGQKFTGFRPDRSSVELFEIRLNPTPDILRYNAVTSNGIDRYSAPYPYYPMPTLDDYARGHFQRFFIQKRNSPLNSIMEVNVEQYNSVNTQGNPGLNGVVWNRLLLEWKISKIPKADAEYLNSSAVARSEPSFPGIINHLPNGLEFFR